MNKLAQELVNTINHPHTPGRVIPGAVGITIAGTTAEHFAVGVEGTKVAVAITGLVDDDECLQSAANARRIAACWNACEGIPTEELEPGAYEHHIIDTGMEIGRLSAQRDALLEALRHAVKQTPELITVPVIRAALAQSTKEAA